MEHSAVREEHPLFAVIAHWTHLVSMVVLAFTGAYIHYPFFEWQMAVARTLHFIFMYVVLAAFVARLYFALFGRSATLAASRTLRRDARNFVPQAENRGQLLEIAKYYLFLRKTHPATGKYNPLQKLAYSAMGLLLVMQAVTGFTMYSPLRDTPFLVWVTGSLGGLMAVRQIHYLTMWAFIALVMGHVYLSVAEGLRQLPLMLWWRESTPAEGE
jgi:Ni/Fe-hydrogenase 1 B-type cytochrome subunit